MRFACAIAVTLASGCTFDIDLGRGVPVDGADGPTGDTPLDEMLPPDPCMPVQVAASSAHNCVRMANGDVWCWGMNSQGQVGRPIQRLCNGAIGCNPLPEKIDVTDATGLGMGDQHGCVIAGASTYCMGADDSGQFGDNNAGDAAAPRLVAQRANADEIVGGDTHTCSRHGNQVRCSGQNTKSECGDGTLLPRAEPVVTFASGADAIGTGYQHACAIDDGLVYCWGENTAGQSGGAGSLVMIPRLVQNVPDAIEVTGGLNHTCALQSGGTVRCWGLNANGQLGTSDVVTPIGPVNTQIAGIVQISAGVNHTCALASGGTVYCWGEGYSPTPTAVVLPTIATQIASGSYHDCFVLAPSANEPHGSVWCTGWDAYGQLGRGGDPGTTLGPGPVTLCP